MQSNHQYILGLDSRLTNDSKVPELDYPVPIIVSEESQCDFRQLKFTSG